jgi:hypothetical protein
LLEELRMITNLVREGQSRVRLILSGSLLIEERFAHPKLDSFSQRLSARCYLEALDPDETRGYVRFHVQSAGGDPNRLFEENALHNVHRATGGVPRLINQLCDHALMLARVAGKATIDAAMIDEAWADLQQLPAPADASREQAAAASKTIEFGGLDEGGFDVGGLDDGALDNGGEEGPDAIPFRPAAGRAFETLTPEAKLDRIERQLAAIDDDFQPVGSIGPEVELLFQDGTDPFGGQFESEEILLDRYGELDMFGESPPVASAEGRQLGAMLEPFDRRDPRAVGTMPAKDAAANKTAAARTQPNSPSSAAEKQATHAAAAEDDDMIIVEDDGPEGTNMAASLRPAARRQEYRQLFAKLRRG